MQCTFALSSERKLEVRRQLRREAHEYFDKAIAHEVEDIARRVRRIRGDA